MLSAIWELGELLATEATLLTMASRTCTWLTEPKPYPNPSEQGCLANAVHRTAERKKVGTEVKQVNLPGLSQQAS